MNTFKRNRTVYSNAMNNGIGISKINIDSISDFPILNNKIKIENGNNFNFIDATKKKVEEKKQPEDTGLCTIYYDKKLKKVMAHNFPKKMYNDDISDNNSDTNSNFFVEEAENIPNPYNIKHLKLHNGMNKTIRSIMERRDKFIDQYGVDEYVRDYLPKDSPYLYSRYYYKNKYSNNNYKNSIKNKNNNTSEYENNTIEPIEPIDPTIENDLILYDDIDLDVDIDLDDDIDEDDI